MHEYTCVCYTRFTPKISGVTPSEIRKLCYRAALKGWSAASLYGRSPY